MKILILGAGKMGSFFCDLLSFDHDVAVYDPDPMRLRFTFNARRFATPGEIASFEPQLVINAATVKYTIEAFRAIMDVIPPTAILSDIASVKTGLPEFYATCGHPFVSTHPMFGPTFASRAILRMKMLSSSAKEIASVKFFSKTSTTGWDSTLRNIHLKNMTLQ